MKAKKLLHGIKNALFFSLSSFTGFFGFSNTCNAQINVSPQVFNENDSIALTFNGGQTLWWKIFYDLPDSSLSIGVTHLGSTSIDLTALLSGFYQIRILEEGIFLGSLTLIKQ